MCATCGCDCNNITLPSATDGVSVTGATITGGDLILTLSSGATINAGAVATTANPVIILHNDMTSETTDVYTPGVPTTIGTKTYTVPAATLDTNGSEIRATAWLNMSNTSVDMADTFGFYLGGAWPISVANAFDVAGAGTEWYIKIELVIARVSNTVAFIEQRCWTYRSKYDLVPAMTECRYEYNPAAFTPNFTTTGIDITVKAKALSNSGTDDDVTCDKFTVEVYKKA